MKSNNISPTSKLFTAKQVAAALAAAPDVAIADPDAPATLSEQWADAAVSHSLTDLRAQLVKRRVGRPVAQDPKRAYTIRFSSDVIQGFKATGRGWQTRMDEVLKEWLRANRPAA